MVLLVLCFFVIFFFVLFCFFFFFFFQAEDGIRDVAVTGVQTCALPIFTARIGMSRPLSAMAFAIASSVPSPPSTTKRSACAGISVRSAVAREPDPNSLAASVDHTASTPRSRSHASRSTSVSRAAASPGLTAIPIRILSGPQDLRASGPEMYQEFFVAFGTGDWGINHRDSLQSYFSRRRGHVGDNARVHGGVLHQSPFADVAAPRFELRFHQRH